SIGTKLPTYLRGVPEAGGMPELREEVTKYLSHHQLGNPSMEEVLITPGVMGAFQTVLQSFVSPGDRIVLFDPSSPCYPSAIKPFRASIQWVETHMEDGHLRFRMEDLARAT